MAGANIVRKLVGAVAKKAPAGRRAVVNIGLDIPGGGRLAPEEALAALQRFGIKPVRATLAQSDTEPTLVVELPRSLAPDEAHQVSAMLQQEAIAQVDELGRGDLYGPGADKWRPFSGDYFIDGDGRRLTQAIMEAGDPEAIPGGAPPDPVMDRMNEVLAGLGQERPAYAGGGVVKKVVGALTDAITDAPAKSMRLYHGTAGRGTLNGGFEMLDPNRRSHQLGLHLGSKPQADYFASGREHLTDVDLMLNKEHFSRVATEKGRIIPLDVDLKNPVRLEDRAGDWRPSDVFQQLVAQGKVPDDPVTHARLKKMQNSADPNDRDLAMLEVRKMIEDAGHDGAVYLNRLEGFLTEDELKHRFKDRGINLRNADDNTFLDVVPEAKGNDSYIVWDETKMRSPFGGGPGVGYAKGGIVNKLGKGLIDMLDFSGVSGKPKSVKIPGRGEVAALPIEEVDEAAEAYMKEHGIPGTHRISEYPEFDEEFARRIADAYGAAEHAPGDPSVRRAYEALIDETMAQYRALEDTGLDVRFLREGMDDPYAASPSMGYADMVDNGKLWVFPTDFGFGSSAFDAASNPLLKKVGRVGDKDDAVANDAFRVVHDAYGHFGPGNPFFRHQGEDRAWQHHGRMFTDDALPAMTAETRGQNSWLNFGPYGEQNRKALGADTIFADQKATVMPSWTYERGLGRKPRFAEGGPVLSAEDIASMTHDQSYGTGRAMNYLDTLGEEVPLGEVNYFDVDGERQMPGGIQALHDVARLGIYGVPVVGPWLGAGLDLTEAAATEDPTSALAAVAFGPGGKMAKGAMTGALAYGMDPEDAEAGMFGLASKWARSSEGTDALRAASKAISEGADPERVRLQTGWFKDLDGSWKFELPSAGGSADLSRPGKFNLADYYDDPNLFEQYPGMKTLKIGRMRSEGASYYPDFNRIEVGDISHPWFNRPEIGGLKGVLDHEIYHAKSAKEGWAQGTNKDEAQSAIMRDIKRFLGSKGDPERKVTGKGLSLYSPQQMSALALSRYEAEMGEALASREAMRRDFGWEQITKGVPPTDDISVPKAALFDPNKYATPDNYSALVNWHNSRVKK